MSNENHIEEKEVLQVVDSFTRVGDIQPQRNNERVPLEPMEAMAFAQEYIQQLNE